MGKRQSIIERRRDKEGCVSFIRRWQMSLRRRGYVLREIAIDSWPNRDGKAFDGKGSLTIYTEVIRRPRRPLHSIGVRRANEARRVDHK